MSETTPESAPKTDPKPTPQQVADAANHGKPDETPEQTIEGLRAALAKANTEAKDNRLKAAELDTLKQAQMSEAEKQTARIKELEGEMPIAVAKAFRDAAVTFGGISEEDAETFLTGGDLESLSKQAQRLIALAKQPTTPKPDLTQGGNGGVQTGTPEQDFATFLKTQLGQ